ncbi:hypothetical protein BJ546DRAFT_1051359 [Cryomyces antarcticus]|uniref:LITAF domain-containing protein n=1 Tax=Cryomyces antarcticus TaxID=329879 RepID=A0ABR0KSL1_9PEZI|nr:hypothetical protein LTR60_002408 [Cryomyces antarcticus]KAK5125864.1 hypothetical protein LTR16_003222 [Cryomyces antarcticus]
MLLNLSFHIQTSSSTAPRWLHPYPSTGLWNSASKQLAKTSQKHQARGARVEAARVAAGLARVAKPYVPKPYVKKKTTPATSAAALLAVATASAAPTPAASKPAASKPAVAQSSIDGYFAPATLPAQTPEAAADFTLPAIPAQTSPAAATIKQPSPYITTLRTSGQLLEVYCETCRSDSS